MRKRYWSAAVVFIFMWSACAHQSDARGLAMVMCEEGRPRTQIDMSGDEQVAILLEVARRLNTSTAGHTSWARVDDTCIRILNETLCLEKTCGSRDDFVARILVNNGLQVVAFGALVGDGVSVRKVERAGFEENW